MLRLQRLSSVVCRSVSQPTTCSATVNMSSYVVDAWAQPPDPELFHNVPEVGRLLKQSHTPLDMLKDFSPKDMAGWMDMAGVDKVLLCAWSRPGMFALTNERVAEFTKAFPEKFVGVAAVDLAHPMTAIAQLEKCVKEYGFKAVRVLPWLWNMPPTHNLYYPLYAKCVELDIPFCTQVGHTGPLCPSEPGRPVPYIDQVALDFPELKIIGGHIGYPWTDEMIGVAWKHANVYIDTSAHAPKYYPKQLVDFMNSYGADKVMFGTNFPQLIFGPCVEQAKKLPLKKEAMEKFLWRNADQVFKLGMAEEPKAKL